MLDEVAVLVSRGSEFDISSWRSGYESDEVFVGEEAVADVTVSLNCEPRNLAQIRSLKLATIQLEDFAPFIHHDLDIPENFSAVYPTTDSQNIRHFEDLENQNSGELLLETNEVQTL